MGIEPKATCAETENFHLTKTYRMKPQLMTYHFHSYTCQNLFPVLPREDMWDCEVLRTSSRELHSDVKAIAPELPALTPGIHVALVKVNSTKFQSFTLNDSKKNQECLKMVWSGLKEFLNFIGNISSKSH